MPMTDDELIALLENLENDSAERKESYSNEARDTGTPISMCVCK